MAKRKNRAATEQELGLITDIQPDARMNDHHEQHSNANKAIVDLYHALDIDVDGNTGDLELGADFGNNVPETTGHAGKVLATDGTDYGWSYVDSNHILLTSNLNPFGILDDPAANDPNLTQAGANALFVKYIEENEEAVKELALALGLQLEVDANGDITIIVDPNGTNPSLGDKFDAKDAVGAAPSNLTNAKDMEDAIDSNKSDIGKLVVGLGGDIDNISVDTSQIEADIAQNASDIADNASDIAQNTTDIAKKFDKDVQGGAGPVAYTTALSMENAIDNNKTSIGNLDTKIDQVIEELTGGDATVNLDVTSKLDRGNTNYANAEAIESAVTTLETTKAHVDHDHDLDYATKAELSTEASDRAAGDAQTLQDAKDYANTISVDTSDKFDKGTGPLNYADATALGNAVDALSSGSGYDDSGVKADIATNAADIATNAAAIADKLDKGATTYADAGVMETDIKKNATDIADNATDIATNATEIGKKFDKGATTYSDAKAMEDAIKTNADAITTINSSGYDDSALRGLISDEETARVAGDTTLQDQIDNIQSSGYDDTQLRSDFAAADAATLSSANAYTDQEVAAITVPDVSDLATKTEVSDGDTATLTAANAYTDGKVYDATSLEADVAQNTSDISALQTEQGTQDDAIQANTDALGNKSDSTHTHPPQDLTHDHSGTYQPVGDYATKKDLEGKENVGHTHPDPDLTHDHDDEYAKAEELEMLKNEIIDIEAELEAIAPNREKGEWEATDTGAPRPGQANLANPSFTVQENILVINQVDANQETHTFSEVEEGDNIEIAVDENNLGLYEVGPSTRSDIVTLNLNLIKGQGSMKVGDQIKINIFGLADQNLDLEELDNRYLQLTGGDLSAAAKLGTNRLGPIAGGENTLYEGKDYSQPQALINSDMMKEYAAEKEHEHDTLSAVPVGLEPPEQP